MSASCVTTTMVTPCSRLSDDKRVHNLMRGARIEIAGWLVSKQNARRVDQRAGDSDALLLAAGELAGRIVLAFTEIRAGQGRPRALAADAIARDESLRVEQRQCDVLDGAGACQQVESLKHKTEPFAAEPRELGLAKPRDIDAVKEILPLVGRSRQPRIDISVDLPDPDEPTMATNSPAIDSEIDTTQSMHIHVAHMVDAREILYSDFFFGHLRPFGYGLV